MAADLPKIQRSLERGTNGISHFIWNGATFQLEAKMTKWILNFFPVMEWSTDTKTGYDDLEVYMEYGYVFVSSPGRNYVKMVAFSFKHTATEARLYCLQIAKSMCQWLPRHVMNVKYVMLIKSSRYIRVTLCFCTGMPPLPLPPPPLPPAADYCSRSNFRTAFQVSFIFGRLDGPDL